MVTKEILNRKGARKAEDIPNAVILVLKKEKLKLQI